MNDAAETIAAPQPVALGSLIDACHSLREQKRALEAEVKEINQALTALEVQLLEQLDQQGLTLCRGQRARVSVTQSVVPNVTDWDAYYEYIKENDAFYMLERRASVKAWRELHEGGTEVPGTEPFTKRGINVTSI